MNIENEIVTDRVIELESGESIKNSHLTRCDLRQIPEAVTITGNIMNDCLLPDWWHNLIIILEVDVSR